MSDRLRIPAILAFTVLGAGTIAATSGTIASCGGGSSPPVDVMSCPEGMCVQNPTPDAGVCESAGSCASNFMCSDPDCLVT